MAGVALMALYWLWWRTWVLWSPRLFACQAWHLAESTCILRGRRGTYRTGLALVARLGTLVAAAVCMPGVSLGNINRHFAWQAWPLVTSTVTLRGRPGTWRHRRVFCVAGVALMALDWLWWRAWVLWSPRLFAPGVALGDIDHRPSL